MMIHPPMLYSGYVALTVPFAFAIGALITRRLDAEWIRSTRRFALIAWTFLGFGLLLGARWSYTELGWGGYWAWDPVENAALMPWLLGTAFLHSIMVQEKRGMLKVWNACLIVATFSMALLGTFLVRSGVLQSIHAFGDNTVGPYILGLIGVVMIGSTALIVSRLDDLRSPKRIDSLVSRESVFLINNLLLVGLAAVIFWGTFFPLISELFTGQKASLAAPWFDHYTTPLAILLVLFTGIGPLLAWRRVTWASARRVFRVPLIVAAVALVGLLAFTDAAAQALGAGAVRLRRLRDRRPRPGVLERRRRPAAASPAARWPAPRSAVVARNRRRYGGYIVHIGIAVVLIGIAASSSFQTNRDVDLKPGESTDRRRACNSPTCGRRSRSTPRSSPSSPSRRPRRTASWSTTLRPSRRFFRPTGVAGGDDLQLLQRRGDQRGRPERRPRRDIWIASQPDITTVQHQLGVADRDLRQLRPRRPGHAASVQRPDRPDARRANRTPAAAPKRWRQIGKLQSLTAENIARGYVADDSATTFKVIVNPLVTWMWIGGLIALTGALIAVWPSRGRRERRYGPHRGRCAEGSEVPRDPRRRTRPRLRQALRRGLRHARRRAAPRSGRDPRPGRGPTATAPTATARTRTATAPPPTATTLPRSSSRARLNGRVHDSRRHPGRIAVALIFLVLLHSGKDAGLSGAFGIGGGGSSLGGGSMVERNLDRATVFFAVLFVLNTFVLLKI